MFIMFVGLAWCIRDIEKRSAHKGSINRNLYAACYQNVHKKRSVIILKEILWIMIVLGAALWWLTPLVGSSGITAMNFFGGMSYLIGLSFLEAPLREVEKIYWQELLRSAEKS
jgi:hypothetical protein